MPEYRSRLESRLPEILRAVDAMPGQLSDVVPGLSKADLKRMFQRCSRLLARVDKENLKSPQFLWLDGNLAPEILIGRVDTLLSTMSQGANVFVSNDLGTITRSLDALERAVGYDSAEADRIGPAILEGLESAVSRSDEVIAHLIDASSSVDSLLASTSRSYEEIRRVSTEAVEILERMKAARVQVDELFSGTRGKPSIEKLMASARQIIDRMNELEVTARDHVQSSQEASIAAVKVSADISKISEKADQTAAKAERVLGLSSKAGLASSYIAESERLLEEAKNLKYTIYGVVALIVGLLAFWIIPELNEAIASRDLAQGVLALFLRSILIIPLGYIIYFLNRQVKNADLLRMDYAEKAAASLAYSGYREEMQQDDVLLNRLRLSLLDRFSEHPERLFHRAQKMQGEQPDPNVLSRTPPKPVDNDSVED